MEHGSKLESDEGNGIERAFGAEFLVIKNQDTYDIYEIYMKCGNGKFRLFFSEKRTWVKTCLDLVIVDG